MVAVVVTVPSTARAPSPDTTFSDWLDTNSLHDTVVGIYDREKPENNLEPELFSTYYAEAETAAGAEAGAGEPWDARYVLHDHA